MGIVERFKSYGAAAHFPSELLTAQRRSRYSFYMAQSFLIFDFGSNEEAAQQARHTIERWKQAFRLDKKLLLKFDRVEQPAKEEPKSKGKEENGSENPRVTVIVRLDFSDHEKLSQQRWLDRIPSEAPFKEAHPKLVRHGDEEFEPTTKRFDELE